MTTATMRRARRGLGLLTSLALATGLVGLGATAGGAAQADGTGPQPPGVGRGSKAALAQETCDPATKRTSFVYVGTGPLCVNPWPDGKDNGGATATGVTATDVKVVVYQPNASMVAAQQASGQQTPRNQASGEPTTNDKVIVDFDAIYKYATETYGTYQLWGRTPVYEFVTASGTDETAQRADALEVVAKKPFLVIDTSDPVIGADVFSATVAGRKTLVVSASTTPETAAQQRPYRWILGQDRGAAAYLSADFVGRSLAGEKARWAGDESMTSKTRSIGVIYPKTGIDLDAFREVLRESGKAQVTEAVEYDNSDQTKFEELAPPYVTKLKTSGVTTVVLLAEPNMVGALMAAATSQEYSPEWIITGYAFHDFDGFPRGWDEEQMKHAFGTGALPPVYEGTTSTTGLFDWYWGKEQGNNSQALQSVVGFIYAAIQNAGPKLTAKNVEKGFFAVPAAGGAADGTTNFQSGYGRTVRLPYDEYGSPGTDRNLAWWNPDITGGANAVASIVGKGKFVYLDDAKRYAFGEFPDKQPKFFDESVSVAEVPRSSAYANGVLPEPNLCTGCPVNGGSGA